MAAAAKAHNALVTFIDILLNILFSLVSSAASDC
ncbi:hypothetical protein CECT5772_01311 [Streptococcus equi subsp. ruminatorum CECT 5772]|uniref:Uncharacterized protein n=1 Tax=Streptococcus equi subsp. ruminatorum CECT 5772 TaxID=1051981 RepID=A0A922NW07_9STRE|nr:hypothetical protein CECT5772_01311 [Streptococcus equi subsp. ruminatorum CECT 5772]